MANSKSKKHKKFLVLSLILLVLVALTATAILKKKDAIITVQKEKIARRNLTEVVVANGKIQPVVQVKISPEVSGEIIELPVKEGQCVKKGDLLVKIKPDNYVASRNSADANFKYSIANSNTAWANLEKAELEFKRNESLFNTKLISDSTFLEAKTTYHVAKANLSAASQQVEMAQASLQKAEDDLSKTTIYSPLDGTVTKLNSQLGERVVGTAMMAGTEIMTVSDLNAMETRVDIGEIDVVLIQVGQKARLDVDAFKDRKFSGTVTDIANSAKNSSNSTSTTSQEATKFEVKIRIDEKEQFRPGMSVTAEIETRYRTNVITVPIQSVTTRFPKDAKKNDVELAKKETAAAGLTPGSSTAASEKKKKQSEAPKAAEVVFLVDGDHVRMVPVKRGISDDNYVEITDGLKEDQTVVSGGYKAINRELEDGKQIIIGDAKKEGEKK
jgi:HlyD family secretion protein